MNFKQVLVTTIHADNQGCIVLAYNPVNHTCTKHIAIQHHFIHKCIANKEIDLCFVSTKDMLADIFTKQLPHKTFKKFWDALGVGEY